MNLSRQVPTVGCHQCVHMDTCAGMEDKFELLGCGTIDHSQCVEKGWTCFCNPQLLAERYSEVGGFSIIPRSKLLVPSEDFGLYIPMIYHAGSRREQLDLDWAAVPIYTLLGRRRNGHYGSMARDSKDLLSKL